MSNRHDWTKLYLRRIILKFCQRRIKRRKLRESVHVCLGWGHWCFSGRNFASTISMSLVRLDGNLWQTPDWVQCSPYFIVSRGSRLFARAAHIYIYKERESARGREGFLTTFVRDQDRGKKRNNGRGQKSSAWGIRPRERACAVIFLISKKSNDITRKKIITPRLTFCVLLL